MVKFVVKLSFLCHKECAMRGKSSETFWWRAHTGIFMVGMDGDIDSKSPKFQ